VKLQRPRPIHSPVDIKIPLYFSFDLLTDPLIVNSYKPPLIRAAIFTIISTHNNQGNQTKNAGSARPNPTHKPNAPNTNARSLLPIGPWYCRGAPTIGPSAPVISDKAANQITANIPKGEKGAIKQNGR